MARCRPAAAFPVDVDLPELTVAADAVVMKDVFAQLLTAADAPVAVEGCRISRIRYRQHTRCLVQYALTLRNTATGESIDQWASGTIYAEAGRARRVWHDSLAGTVGARHGLVPSAAFIPELCMAIDFFPHDHRLRHAARLIHERDDALEAAVLRAFGGGAWTITRWAAEPVRYREHLALVVRCTVDATDAQRRTHARKTFFVKTYRDADQPRRVYEHLCTLARHAAVSPIGVHIDAPLACLDHLDALLIEGTAGRPLDALLGGGDETAIDAAVRVTARALATFNLSDAPAPRVYPVADHLAAVGRADRLLRCACPDLGDQLEAVAHALRAELRDVVPGPTHRDMKPEHVLLAPSGPALIDLDSCAAADPVMDPALMLARFAALAGREASAARMQQAAATFERQYFALVPAEWHLRLPPYYAGALVEVAAGIFHRQEPAWRLRVAALIAAAHAAVAAPRTRLTSHGART